MFKVPTMLNLRRRQQHKSDPLEAQFASTMQALSQSIVNLMTLLSQPPQQVSATELGSKLAGLLKHIRAHHSAAIALGVRMHEAKIQAKYLQALLDMRATVAQWLTVHAAQPHLIRVEVGDFESQCWSTLGMGIVLLENISTQGAHMEEIMPSRFLRWWQQLDSRPAFLNRQTTGFSSGFY